MNIAAIGATGFRRNLQHVQSAVFSASLYEINYLIEKERADEADDLSYSPLRYQSTDELRAVKQYIIKNLYKGFIEAS